MNSHSGNRQVINVLAPRGTIKLAFIALAVIIILIILSRAVVSVASLNRPITPQLSDKKYFWDGNSVINVVFASQEPGKGTDISVVSFHPKEGKAIVLHIAEQTFLELPKGFGSWPVGSVYRLGEEDSKTGANLLKMSLAKLIGLPMDGVILFNSQDYEQSSTSWMFPSTQYKTPEELIANWKKNPVAPLFDTRNIKSDLTTLEAVRLFKQLSSIREDKLISLDLEQSNITESKLLPDSTRVLGVDAIRLDLFVREKMSDEDILSEGLSIAVFNGTNYPGLTYEVVRAITNMGGNVTVVANTEQPQKKSSVSLSPEYLSENPQTSETNTSLRLKEMVSPDCLKIKCSNTDINVTRSRAQINVVLGEDYFNYWKSR